MEKYIKGLIIFPLILFMIYASVKITDILVAILPSDVAGSEVVVLMAFLTTVAFFAFFAYLAYKEAGF